MIEPRPNNGPDDSLDALFAAARAHRPDTSKAEYGFETRLMAQLRSRRDSSSRDASSVWAMVTWRCIPFLAACVIGMTIWQVQESSDVNDAASLAGLSNPSTTEIWAN